MDKIKEISDLAQERDMAFGLFEPEGRVGIEIVANYPVRGKLVAWADETGFVHFGSKGAPMSLTMPRLLRTKRGAIPRRYYSESHVEWLQRIGVDDHIDGLDVADELISVNVANNESGRIFVGDVPSTEWLSAGGNVLQVYWSGYIRPEDAPALRSVLS